MHRFVCTKKTKTVKLVYVAPPLSMKHLMSKSKDWMAQNQNNVSEWIDMSLTQSLFCACLKPGTGFSMSYALVFFVFSELR
jgi:hypothetical protein